jgi:hypothetical protein
VHIINGTQSENLPLKFPLITIVKFGKLTDTSLNYVKPRFIILTFVEGTWSRLDTSLPLKGLLLYVNVYPQQTAISRRKRGKQEDMKWGRGRAGRRKEGTNYRSS